MDAERKRADREVAAATKVAADSLASTSHIRPQPQNLYGAGTVVQVAERIGASTSALRKSQEAINTTGGLDAIAELRVTTLSSEAELLALGALRKEFPAVAERVMAERNAVVARIEQEPKRKLEEDRIAVRKANAWESASNSQIPTQDRNVHGDHIPVTDERIGTQFSRRRFSC